MGFADRCFRIKPKFYFHIELSKSKHAIPHRYAEAIVERRINRILPTALRSRAVKNARGEGRSCKSRPRQNRSIEIAAVRPEATAETMFFAPLAASPAKKTFGHEDCSVIGSSFG